MERTKGTRPSISPSVRVPRQWLVVEHENGRIEDFGLVDVRFVGGLSQSEDDRSEGPVRFQWQSFDGHSGAAIVDRRDLDKDGLRRPLEVHMRSGEQQFWFFGTHAEARMKAHRYYVAKLG